MSGNWLDERIRQHKSQQHRNDLETYPTLQPHQSLSGNYRSHQDMTRVLGYTPSNGFVENGGNSRLNIAYDMLMKNGYKHNNRQLGNVFKNTSRNMIFGKNNKS